MTTERTNVPFDASYIEGLRITALNAIDCLAYDTAHTLLEIGLAYAYGAEMPIEAEHLWKAKLKLGTCRLCIDHPEDFGDPDALWQKYMDETIKLLGGTP